MAMASSTTLLPARCSAALACRPRCRANATSDSAVPVKQLSPDSAADGACVSWNAPTEVQETGIGIGIGRRGVMISVAASAVLLFAVEDSKAADAGLFSKYLKRKKLDPLDTYVPTVVLAQLQFQDVDGKLAGEKPEFSDARSLLRSGPAGSLRNDMRAVAQYADEAGDGKTANEAVDQCLSALEDLDSLLLRATREEGSPSVDVMKTRVSAAVTALDKLLATVPSNILEKGKAIATAYRDQSTTTSDDNLGSDETIDELKGLL
ncbi:hypothetical protein KC19_1G246500 [Ceratodon purpureus]|uniref:DUF7880 domain-containing protein n=1 Tax=Ceratodon purpureus TaxID=3225 RepID=A0A8T0JBB1_CERPU|nr:hypothetical protein KC19_1G246500 [Ceratodon purpureus]